jgi:hypothetical protein
VPREGTGMGLKSQGQESSFVNKLETKLVMETDPLSLALEGLKTEHRVSFAMSQVCFLVVQVFPSRQGIPSVVRSLSQSH